MNSIEERLSELQNISILMDSSESWTVSELREQVRKRTENLQKFQDVRSEEDLLLEAWQVQDACNLSGVVHGFSRAMSRLFKLHHDKGTAFLNHHLICKLWASKIQSLTGEPTNEDWDIACKLG